MSQILDDYIDSHSQAEPDYLRRLERETNVWLMNPRMVSGHVQGRFLKMLCQMIRPQRVLELGTFSGYSALCMAEGLPEGAVIDTVEIDDELEDFIRRALANSPYEAVVNLIIGDALEVLPTLEATYDLVFIDADKRLYRYYFEAVLPKVRQGGFILADNTLWNGKVVEPVAHGDNQTRAIMAFNDFIVADTRVEQFILPLRDGLTMMRKK